MNSSEPSSANECTEAVAQLFSFMDGMLQAEQHQLLQAHFDTCPPCTDAYYFQVHLRVVVQRRCREELPAGLRDRVFGQILGTDPFGSDSGPGL